MFESNLLYLVMRCYNKLVEILLETFRVYVFFIFPAYASFLPQNGGNRVCEDLKFQNYPGEDVPGPPFQEDCLRQPHFIEPPLLKKKLDPPQQGMFTGVIYFDLKKAFDTLDNKISLLSVPQGSILGP